jgi:hypothetical protein
VLLLFFPPSLSLLPSSLPSLSATGFTGATLLFPTDSNPKLVLSWTPAFQSNTYTLSFNFNSHFVPPSWLTTPAIIGISFGAFGALVLLGVGGYCCYKKRKEEQERYADPTVNGNHYSHIHPPPPSSTSSSTTTQEHHPQQQQHSSASSSSSSSSSSQQQQSEAYQANYIPIENHILIRPVTSDDKP